MATVYMTLGVFIILTILFHVVLNFAWSGNIIFWKFVDYFSVLSSTVAIVFAIFSGHIQDKKTQLEYLKRDILSSSIILLHAQNAPKKLDEELGELSHIIDHLGQMQLDNVNDFTKYSDELNHIRRDVPCKNIPVPSDDVFETALTLQFLCSLLNKSVETSEYIDKMIFVEAIVKFWNIILALGASLAVVKITATTRQDS